MSDSLWFESHGKGSPTLVLLHGLGANAAVWHRLRPYLDREWPARWIAPDLLGHGRSRHAPPYGFGRHASGVAALLDQDEDVLVLAHSMGGAVGIALASGWFGVRVRQVAAFGVKINWTADEIERMHRLAHAPAKWFENRQEAIDRYLRVSGLQGLIEPHSSAAALGIVEERGRFRLAMDPLANCVVGPGLEDQIKAMQAPLRLTAGEADPMVSIEEIRRIDPQAVVLTRCGHNPHVENPAQLWLWFRQGAATLTR